MKRLLHLIVVVSLLGIVSCEKEIQYGAVVIYHVGTGEEDIKGFAILDALKGPYRTEGGDWFKFTVKSFGEDIKGQKGVQGTYSMNQLKQGSFKVYINGVEQIDAFVITGNSTTWYRIPDDLIPIPQE